MGKDRKYTHNPWKTILIYILVGTFWIVFSDRLLELLIRDHGTYVLLQSYKGTFYVLVTALMLFFLIKLDYRQILLLTRTVGVKNRALSGAMADLQGQKRYVDEIYDNSNTAMMTWDLSGRILGANRHFMDLFACSEEAVRGADWQGMLAPGEGPRTIGSLVDQLIEERSIKNREIAMVTGEGRELVMLWNFALVDHPETGEAAVASFGMDMTAEKENEKQIFRLAYKDRMTGLDNRIVFEKDITRLIEEERPFSLYYLDFDNFRNVNDIYGHFYGDLFLAGFAETLRSRFESCRLYRLGGDEFMVLDESVSEEAVAEKTKLLLAASMEKWTYQAIEYYPTASIGVARFPEDGDCMKDVFKNVEIALHHAKTRGKASASLFKQDFQEHVARRLTVETAIYEALSGDGFELHYQPIYDLGSRRIASIEALLRWKAGKHDIPTGEFIEVAEETGQILKIDLWVVEQVFGFAAEKLADSQVPVSINLSARTVEAEGTIPFLKACLAKHRVDPARIEFELTEHSIVQDLQRSYAFIQSLKDLGFKVALDDFGTKYSSLNYLSSLPFNNLKIDKSYIDRMTEVPSDRIIVEEIITLTKRLGIETIAEGIETREQADLLSALRCDFGQGYYLARPIDEAGILALLGQDGGGSRS